MSDSCSEVALVTLPNSSANNSLIEFLLPSLNPSPDAAHSARPPEMNRRKFTEVRRNPRGGFLAPKEAVAVKTWFRLRHCHARRVAPSWLRDGSRSLFVGSSCLQDARHGLQRPPKTANMASEGLPSRAKMVSKSTFFGFLMFLKHPKSNFYWKTHRFFNIFENHSRAEKCQFGDHLGATWEALRGHVGHLGRPLEAMSGVLEAT